MHIELCKWVEEYDSYKMDNGKWTCVNKDVVKVRCRHLRKHVGLVSWMS